MSLLHPESNTKILVTGVNGFVAFWAARRLLERGYSVRGTVRSVAKGAFIQKYFESYGDRFELAYVEDFTTEGAFDESVVGVHGILHVATPIPSGDLEEPDDFVKPAVGGAVGILKSAQKSPSMKRVIYTSSTGTISRPVSEPTSISEKDWNDDAVEALEKLGIKAHNHVKYLASKVLAEKTAWDYYEQNKDTLGYIPPIHELGTSPSSMGNSSFGIWYNNVVGNPTQPRADELLEEVNGWVDVRDLADAHITALEREEAVGERIIVAAGRASWQEWIDVANGVLSSSSEVALAQPIPKGKPGIEPKVLRMYDTSKEAKILGTKFRKMDETTKDMLVVFAKKGW
ncbi:hypothetical protein BDQ17DRAFT_1372801 [Cyathus striatus]|nr:hypothetical protein BDQ17DRAFT_1372801 [Cyathus striatus]